MARRSKVQQHVLCIATPIHLKPTLGVWCVLGKCLSHLVDTVDQKPTFLVLYAPPEGRSLLLGTSPWSSPPNLSRDSDWNAICRYRQGIVELESRGTIVISADATKVLVATGSVPKL
jgi:hypothetical protein